MTTIRPIQQIITAHQQKEGAGFLVRRPFPTHGLDQVDPFLMLDELGPVDYGPGEAIGAPDHPHRGFETVSYIISGEKLHEDTSGDAQIIHAGDVQWMTAGAGVVHSEMPSPRVMEEGITAHGFQIWVNLPASHKMIPPKYQYVPKAEIPIGRSDDGKIEVTVIAGAAFGVEAKIGTHTPIWLQDWRVDSGGSAEFAVEAGHNIAAYVFDGSISFGVEENVIERGQLGLFGPGDSIRINPTGTGRFLLLSGLALNEPVARYGPFVMNTREELVTAFDDYQAGRMGQIKREAS